ncbi:hypothetical protein T01_12435 [Trichinella spiralis]|uniref:Apple domain-containing protein n=1 Tax=Trichinella spiralis TaxID=6334 RepID=A0A0V0YYU5_TRISP|nr:hypothetical protein T01_12435 [Trichinella spiralis]
MCLLELYEPLRLSGWKTITTIENTVSLQECLSKCASAGRSAHHLLDPGILFSQSYCIVN